MTQITRKIVVRDQRYLVQEGVEAGVCLVRFVAGQTEMFGARPLDISPSGMKLCTSTALGLHERVMLVICCGSVQLQMPSGVSWCRPATPGEWWLGCVFESRLCEAHLAEMARLGLFERRRETRHLVDLPAIAKWELAALNGNQVQIADYSTNGMRLISPRPAEPGQRLLVQLEGSPEAPLFLTARCQWIRALEDGFEMGCTFLDKQSVGRVRDRHAQSQVSETADRKRNWLWLW